LAVEKEVVEKRGSFYSYGETRLGQGREKSKDFLRENPTLASEIEVNVRGALVPEEIMPLEDEEDLSDANFNAAE
jgi:recombination protein RecA